MPNERKTKHAAPRGTCAADGSIDGLSKQQRCILGPRNVIGLDFGFIAPGEKRGYAYIHPNDVGKLSLKFLRTLDEFFVREGKV